MNSEGAAQPAAATVGTRASILLLTVGLLTGAFWWTVHWMVVRWDETNSYYSHGWLIAPICLYLLYRERAAVAARPKQGTLAGLWLLVPAAVIHLSAVTLQVGFVAGFALIGVLAGAIATLFGYGLLHVVWFPLTFLVFMVPMPEVLVEKVSFNMKLLAAQAATFVADSIGIIAVREGSFIRIPSGTLIVDDVCSGLKYLISLAAFGALYAWLSSLRAWQKLALFLIALPISFLANVARVTLMVMIGYYWSIPATQKWYSHDFFGFALFVVAFLLLFLVESLFLVLGRAGRAPESPAAPAQVAASGAVPSWAIPRRVTLVLLSILLCVSALSLLVTWPRATPAATARVAAFPLRLGDWSGADYELDERTYQILGTRDVLSRSYAHPRYGSVSFVLVLSQQTGRRTHPPEQCFRGEGYAVTSRRDLRIEVGAEHPLPVRELLLERAGQSRLAWYFFRSGENYDDNYWTHQLRVTLRRLRHPDAADVLIRVDMPVTGTDVEGARASLKGFLSEFRQGFSADIP